jgi:hypothetical protein
MRIQYYILYCNKFEIQNNLIIIFTLIFIIFYFFLLFFIYINLIYK